MALVRNLNEYKRYINNNEFIFKSSNELISFKELLSQQLNNIHSNLHHYLLNMSNDEKSELVKALITNNSEKLIELLAVKGPLSQFKHLVKDLALHDTELDLDKWLNDITLKFIYVLLDLHPTSTEKDRLKAKIILSKAFTTIPDTTFDVSVKRSLYLSMNLIRHGLDENLLLYYKEAIPPLQSNKYKGEITQKQYSTIMNHTVDKSEYILLTLALLQTIEKQNTKIDECLQKISGYYLALNYNDAMKEIDNICLVLNNDLSQLITFAQNKMIEIEPSRNYSRRFFENRICAFYTGIYLNDPSVLKSISNICAYFFGSDYGDLKNSNQALSAINELGEIEDTSKAKLRDKIRNSVALWKTRSRTLKSGFVRKIEEAKGETGESVHSRNPGVMVSNQPNFYDEVTKNNLRNKTADISIPEKNTEYQILRANSPYVGTLSGHVFHYLVFLEEYINHNKSSPTLEKDINNFVLALVMGMVAYGFHSLYEVIDVFALPEVQSRFKQLGITLTIELSDDIVGPAMIDTQEYVKLICLKRGINLEFDLYSAVSNEDFNLARQLLASGCNKHILDRNGRDELFIAIEKKDINMVQLLLANAPAIHHMDNEGLTPLAYANSIGSGDEIIKSLSDYMAAHPAHSQHQLNLYLAVNRNDLETAKKMLKAGAKPDYVDDYGETELFRAIKNDNVKMIKLLIRYGANVNHQSGNGSTPLINFLNSDSKKQEIVDLLISNGADVSLTENVNGCDALIYAIQNLSVTNLNSILSRVSDINAERDGEVPLSYAIHANNTLAIQLLLNHPTVDVNRINVSGVTPLGAALLKNNIDVVKQLIQKNADVNCKSEGYTPIQIAIALKNLPLIQALLENGADLTCTDNDGASAIIHALNSGDGKILEVIMNPKFVTIIKDSQQAMLMAQLCGIQTLMDEFNMESKMANQLIKIGIAKPYHLNTNHITKVVEALTNECSRFFKLKLFEDSALKKHQQFLQKLNAYTDSCAKLTSSKLQPK